MKVPCLICLNKVEVKDNKIVATVCNNCLTDKNIEEIGKNFTLAKLKEVLKKFKERPNINEYGEVVWKETTMLKPSELSVKLDLAQFDKAAKMLNDMYKKIVEYNKEVAKSNKLLRDQEELRKRLNVSVKDGKTIGLVKEENNG